MDDPKVLDFKPRARSLLIGGIPWLARITDKARACMAGRIGDYVYPCPADQRFLAQMQLSAEEFTEIVATSVADDEVIRRVKEHLAALPAR